LLKGGTHSYYDQPVAATIDRWMSHESIATQGHNSDKRSVISLGPIATKGHITLLQNKPSITVPLFKQCRAKKSMTLHCQDARPRKGSTLVTTNQCQVRMRFMAKVTLTGGTRHQCRSELRSSLTDTVIKDISVGYR
jgi:hypothetical protein